MNLRLDPDSLRFRISKEELPLLLAGEAIVDTIPLTDGLLMTVTMMLGDLSKSGASDFLLLKSACENQGISIKLLLSAKALRELSEKQESKDGVEAIVAGTGKEKMLVTLEVDQGRPKRKSQADG
jgi:hypothetical protein